MTPEIGHLALWLAFGVALMLAVVATVGTARGHLAWMALTRPMAGCLFVLVTLAFACLMASFVSCDYSVRYVAANSNRALPLAYRIAATWGGHEGSMLMWVLMLAGWTAATARRSEGLPAVMHARVLGVLGAVAAALLLFVLTVSNPYTRLFPTPPDGQDLNPLLQDPGMVSHPPVLYMGYVGLAVPFALALAALIDGRLDAAWARWTRRATTLAWMFLTVGIALGSAWAYYELGWGGWWFWDPVENASLMPWLAATALLHSLAVTEKRGSFKAWTVLLAIVAFSLSLLGTFLVRSGVLTSVHAFASDPRRGLFVLALLVCVVGGSLLLYAWRAPQIRRGPGFEPLSRETLLLVNNLLLVTACGVVLLGTLYPLALDALGSDKISVGPPYFESVFVPLLMPMLFLLGLGPLAAWRRERLPDLARRLRWAAGAAIVAALLAAAWRHELSVVGAVAIAMVSWIVASQARLLWERLRPVAGSSGLVARARRLPRATLGMLIAHVGVAVFVIGVTMVRSGEAQRELTLAPGEGADVLGYRFVFEGVKPTSGPNYQALQGVILVEQRGRRVAELRPEKRVYLASGTTLTEAAIDTGLARDLYVALGDATPGGAWTLRLQVKPFVDWIWGGCFVMACGGLIAASRPRRQAQRVEAAAASATPVESPA